MVTTCGCAAAASRTHCLIISPPPPPPLTLVNTHAMPPPSKPGFIPPFNPHDEVELAPNLQAALEQLWQHEARGTSSTGSSTIPTALDGSSSSSSSSSSELAAAYARALAAGQAALQQEVEEALARGSGGADGSSGGGPGGGADADALTSRLEPVKVASGSRVSNALVAALEALTGGDTARVEFLVAALCWLQLQAMPTPLLVDLAALVLEASLKTDDEGEAEAAHAAQFRHYCALLAPKGEAPNGDGARDKAAAAAAVEMRNARPGAPLSAIQYRASKKMQLLDVIAAVAAAQGVTVVELEEKLTKWLVRGGSSSRKVPPPPWRAAAAALM